MSEKIYTVAEKKIVSRRLIAIVPAIFIIEFAVMMYLHYILPPHSFIVTSLIDSLLLVFTLFPLLYVFIFKPMVAQIEELRRDDEERLQLVSAIRQADEAVIIMDVMGNIQYVNPSFEHITGFNHEETIGEHIDSLTSPQLNEQAEKQKRKRISQGEMWKGRLTIKRKDGTFCDVYNSISPIKNDRGKVINFVA
ncbi:MAG: PAS domain S-box protein, partial [SAR324 cluster bacterium]|nr:PAS domain S-box protein [SAR324 cluster bacterium]